MNYPDELIGGEMVPPLVVRDMYVITGEHKGTVYVEAGKLKIEGLLNGALKVKPDSEVEIFGTHQGPVYMEKGSKVSVTGAIQGTTNIDPGSLLIVEEGGLVDGSLFNDGSVILRGVFGGVVNGGGDIKVDGGQIKQPVVKNGFIYFQ
jgi:hypothetical protein